MILFACSLNGYAQQNFEENRTIIGVPAFTALDKSKYTSIVTEKVAEVITNTKRFVVVDRTSLDKVRGEMDLQMGEEFIGSKNIAKQGVAVGAEKIIAGEINKLPILAIKNSAGGVIGYKCNVSFQMKIIDVETGISTEAVSFYGKTSEMMLSPESAVTSVMQSMQGQIEEYMRQNFPIKGSVLRVLSINKGKAQSVLLSVGRQQGINVGDSFMIAEIEMVGDKPYPIEIGRVKVTKLAGDTFCECSVGKVGGDRIHNVINGMGGKLYCELIIE